MPTPSGPVSIYILYKRATTDRPTSETIFEWRFAGGGLCAGYLSLIYIDFLLTVKAATLILISWRGSAISSASGPIYDLVKS